jgi:hypothetical protein
VNPENSRDRERLFKAIESSTRQLRPFREKRESLVRQYVGSNYGSGSGDKEVIVNLMYQTAEAYMMTLAAQRPRIMVTSKYPDLTWFSNYFQVAINNLIKEIHLEDTLRKAVLDAFFAIGVVKVYSADAGEVQLEGEDEWVDPGKPFAENISLDDFIYDTRATDWSRIKYCLNKYRISYDKMMDDDAYSKKAKKDIRPDGRRSDRNGTEGEEPLKDIFMGEHQDDDFEDRVDLMDVWLPRDQKIVTWQVNKPGIPLRVMDWDGPEGGPFHVLSLAADVPDHIMPVSPAMNLSPLNLMINGLMRKLRSQAQRQKDVPFYQAGHHDDARRLERASDGEWTRVDNPESVNVLKQGGVDQANMAFNISMQDLFDRMAGNLQLMAGLGPQSGTLGQDQLIKASNSKREANMQYRIVRFTTDICRDLGWLLWNDSIMETEGSYETAGVNVPVKWTPEMREGDWLDYNFEIEPYSMQYKSPSERLSGITNFISQVAMPMFPMMQEYGGTIDIQELVEIYSELMDLPRLKQIVKFQEPKPDRPGPQGEPPKQAAHTVRENVRTNVPTGGTQESRNNVMQQVLMGGSPNADQAAQFGRQKV